MSIQRFDLHDFTSTHQLHPMSSTNMNSSSPISRNNQLPTFDPRPPNVFADAVWRSIRSQLTAAMLATGTPVAVLPLSEIYSKMPLSDQQWILNAFANKVHSPSEWAIVEDEDRAVLHIAGYGPPAGQEIDYVPPSEKSLARATISKVPRPMNSFILYRMDHQDKIKEENPTLKNNDISKLVGEQWKRESTEIRAVYKRKAEKAKRDHALMYPDYQYRPRRPEEKKRRMTKNKRRKLQERLEAEQQVVNLINNRIDPTLCGNSDMGYILQRNEDTLPSIEGVPITMDENTYDFSQDVLDYAGNEIGMMTWDDMAAQTNLIHMPDPFGIDYLPQSGVCPGVYLLSQ